MTKKAVPAITYHGGPINGQTHELNEKEMADLSGATEQYIHRDGEQYRYVRGQDPTQWYYSAPDVEIVCEDGPLKGHKVMATPNAQKHGFAALWLNEATQQSAFYRRDEQGKWRWVDVENIPDILPTTGRIVWYSPTETEAEKLSGLDFDVMYADGYLPAIIMKGSKDGSAILKVFAQSDFLVNVKYNKAGNAGTWRWPVIEKRSK